MRGALCGGWGGLGGTAVQHVTPTAVHPLTCLPPPCLRLLSLLGVRDTFSCSHYVAGLRQLARTVLASAGASPSPPPSPPPSLPPPADGSDPPTPLPVPPGCLSPDQLALALRLAAALVQAQLYYGETWAGSSGWS